MSLPLMFDLTGYLEEGVKKLRGSEAPVWIRRTDRSISTCDGLCVDQSCEVSQTLVGRVSYAEPSVQRELNILFGDDASALVKLVAANCKTMLAVAKKNWRDLFAVEVTRFGKDSFAANKDTFRKTDHIQRHTTATFPELLQLERHKAEKEKIKKQQPVDLGEEVAHDSVDETDDGESMAAYVRINKTDVLSGEDKVHRNDKYSSLGAK
ncbi:hypothetical protein LTR95_001515 [Oleoguttula sp. CCFEE 5521]